MFKVENNDLSAAALAFCVCLVVSCGGKNPEPEVEGGARPFAAENIFLGSVMSQ